MTDKRTAFAAGICAAATVWMAPPAFAEPAPADCTAAVLAHTVSGVTNDMGNYLDAHPDVNAAFTDLKGKPRPEQRADAQQYLAANPSVRDELRQLRAPLTDLGARCGVQIPMPLLGG